MPAFAGLILAGNATLYLAHWDPFPPALLSQMPGLNDASRVLGFLSIQVAALFLVDLLGQLLAARLIEQRFFTGVLLDQLAEGVLAVDLLGAVVYANAEIARLLGLSQSLQGRMADRVLEELPAVLALVRGRGLDERSEMIQERNLVLRAQDVRSASGRPIGRTLVVADETQLRVLEDNARRAEQLAQLGEMAAGIAHEVRNPLTSLRGCSQELSEICLKFGHADAAALAKIMIDESDRLARIVGDFLAMSRLREPVRQLIPLRPVFVELEELSRRRRDLPTAFAIRLTTEADCPEVYADPDQLRQVLSNLINNAIDAVINVSNPRVSVRAMRALEGNVLSGPAVEILVVDNGCGIPAELRERVFAPFFSTKAQGTGLGLSLVSRMVRQHEGVMRLEGAAGGGTVVRLLLPARGPQSRAIPRSADRTASARWGRRREVLGQPRPVLAGVGVVGGAVEAGAGRGQALEGHGADRLRMAQDEVILVRTHLEHRWQSGVPWGQAPARIEEAGVMRPEFAGGGIEGHHLAGQVRRHQHPFAGGEDVEAVLLEEEVAGTRPFDHGEEVLGLVVADAGQVEGPVGAFGDESGRLPRQVGAHHQAAVKQRAIARPLAVRAIEQRRGAVPLEQLGLVEHRP